MQTSVQVFDTDYLNAVNSKRLDDLKRMDNSEKARGAMEDYLDRETRAASIDLHSEDYKNEIMNQDILKDNEGIRIDDYETPLKVVEKFKDLPSLQSVSASPNSKW